jgi:hypothetical protein
MSVLVIDPSEAARMIARRRELGLDSYDEVWDGVYIMSPIADDDHQEIVGGLDGVLQAVIFFPGLGKVRPGVNISDRDKGWTDNYRVPELVVYLPGNPARNRKTHWVGGPDFALEVVSEGDRSREKFDFYATVSTRELLLVDRYPWALELHVLKRKKMRLVGRSTPEDSQWLKSTVLPLEFRLIDGTPRPRIEVRHVDSGQTWLI